MDLKTNLQWICEWRFDVPVPPTAVLMWVWILCKVGHMSIQVSHCEVCKQAWLPQSLPEDTNSYILKTHLRNKHLQNCFGSPFRNAFSLSAAEEKRGDGEKQPRDARFSITASHKIKVLFLLAGVCIEGRFCVRAALKQMDAQNISPWFWNSDFNCHNCWNLFFQSPFIFRNSLVS